MVCASILPVGERGLIRAHRSNRLVLGDHRSFNFLTRLALLPLEDIGSSRVQLHFVRVDDFGLLLKVKGAFVIFVGRLLRLVRVTLLVVTEQLRVRVADESVCTSRLSSTVTDG